MSKRWLINYLLFTLIIIFTWIGYKYPITEDQRINKNEITTLKARDVREIKIETADGAIELQKQNLNWRIIHPIQWFANNIAAERLTTLASLEPHSKLPRDQIDLSTLGLRIPKAVVMLDQQSFYFGDTNRIGNRRYLMVEPHVYLASDIHYAFINQGVAGLLDTRLLPPQLELNTLQFASFKLRKVSSGWTSNQTDRSEQDINRLINNWRHKQASRINPYDASLIPLNKIKASVQNNQEIEFYILSIKPEIIIARPDLKLQYHFPDHQYYELLSLDYADQ